MADHCEGDTVDLLHIDQPIPGRRQLTHAGTQLMAVLEALVDGIRVGGNRGAVALQVGEIHAVEALGTPVEQQQRIAHRHRK